MQTVKKTQSTALSQNNYFIKKCIRCAHLRVCTLFRAIAPLLEQWSEEKPFEAEDLAQICRYFISKSVIETFKQLEEDNH